MFWLVQRLTCKTSPKDEPSPMAPTRTAAGRFDDMFGCEYMGSSEFELMTIPDAYLHMQALKLAVKPIEVTRAGITRTVYFVASPSSAAYVNSHDVNHDQVTTFHQAIEEFKRWFSHDHLRAKEWTNFEHYFADAFPEYVGGGNTCAWWSLDDNMAWTLDEEIAERLLGAFNPVPSQISAPEAESRLGTRHPGSRVLDVPTTGD